MTGPGDRWDARYAAEGYAYGTEPNEFLVEAVDFLTPGSRVLCLAEGEGRNATFLAGLGHQVTGVDASTVGLAKARALAAEREVTIQTVVADLTAFPIEPGAWDGIVSIFAHLPPGPRRHLHEAAVEGLGPGGVFILEAYTPQQLSLATGGPPTRELMMELEVLRQELSGLELRVGREVRREIREGRLHQGPSAVVQLVGIKE